MIEELTEDKDPQVKEFVARFCKYSDKARKRLIADDNIRVRKAVAWNDNTPSTIRQKLINTNYSPIIEKKNETEIRKPNTSQRL